MTANTSIDPARFLHDQLTTASPDLLRQMLTTFIDALIHAQTRRLSAFNAGSSSARIGRIRTTEPSAARASHPAAWTAEREPDPGGIGPSALPMAPSAGPVEDIVIRRVLSSPPLHRAPPYPHRGLRTCR
jgi:hypothetical protein